jgi:ATP synthase protein I
VSGKTHHDEDAELHERRELEERLDQQARRIRRADADRPTLIAQSVYLGSIGILFTMPVLAGAYLGRWLDDKLQGYSVHWTLSMILLGVLVGAVNVYLFIRE